MATVKDFILKSGLQVNTSATIAGVDVLANDYATYTTLSSELSANDYNTLLSAYANDYSTYTTISSAFSANDYATYTTLVSEYSANDYSTYTTLSGELNANDYNTYTTLQGEFAANDGVTLGSARANDYSTYTTLVNEYNANDYSTYTTLQSEYRANDYSTWSGLNSAINIKANSSVTITAGDGLSGGGDLSTSRTISVDSTVVRTSGDQTIAGVKTFSDNIVVEGDLTVEGNTTTIGTTSLLVTDKFIELASNTVGVPAGDVGIYLNRGSFGNSAVYYDQAGGTFALAETADPATNTSVSPTSYANLRINHLSVDSTDLVTNLNADLLDSQSGAYYLDFANATNTDYISLAYVTANGATTTDTISVGGLVVDTDTLYVDSANDRVGVNTLTPAAEFQVSNAAISSSIVVGTSVTQYTLDSLPIADFRTAKYLIQVHDTVANDYQTSELLLIHDDTTAYLTEYAIIYTSGALGSFDAALVSGDIRLYATPTSTNSTTFKVIRQALTL